MITKLSIFSLLVFFCLVSKKALPKLTSWRFTPVISSKSFIVLALTFSSLIHFLVNFCLWCELRVQRCSFPCGCSVVPTLLLKRLYPFPYWMVFAPLLIINQIYILFLIFCFLFAWSFFFLFLLTYLLMDYFNTCFELYFNLCTM